MTEPVDRRFREPLQRFLRGDDGVFDFTHAFRSVVNEVAAARPMQGAELDLFYELEVWETAGWDERVHVVDRLRQMAKAVLMDSASLAVAAVLALHLPATSQSRY